MLLWENVIRPEIRLSRGIHMGKHFIGLNIIISLLTALAWSQEQEILTQNKLIMQSQDMTQVLQKTEADIKAFAENFTVRLDKKSKVVSEQVVSGSVLEPVLNVSIKKCVFIFCQTIDLDAAFKLNVMDGQPGANCARNYLLIVDFQRSSSMLADLYQSMNTTICIDKTAAGYEASLQIALVHAQSYSSGIVQKNAFDLISLQPAAILESFITVMKLNGVSQIQVIQ